MLILLLRDAKAKRKRLGGNKYTTNGMTNSRHIELISIHQYCDTIAIDDLAMSIITTCFSFLIG